jgi:hypothetical protein
MNNMHLHAVASPFDLSRFQCENGMEIVLLATRVHHSCSTVPMETTAASNTVFYLPVDFSTYLGERIDAM